MKVIADIAVDLDLPSLLKQVHLEPDSEDALTFAGLVDLARDIARPKALYAEAYIEEKGADTVRIDAVTFTSRLLRLKLDPVQRVFPFVATCGHEMDTVGLPEDEFMADYWWDMIKTAVLGCAGRRLVRELEKLFLPSGSASVCPGSGDADLWPIQQQNELFALFGDVKDLIGVELTSSCLMVPNKSISGIRFATKTDFRSCQVCKREDCPNRCAPCDPVLWDAVHAVPGQ